jgi:hypothetical protein
LAGEPDDGPVGEGVAIVVFFDLQTMDVPVPIDRVLLGEVDVDHVLEPSTVVWVFGREGRGGIGDGDLDGDHELAHGGVSSCGVRKSTVLLDRGRARSRTLYPCNKRHGPIGRAWVFPKADHARVVSPVRDSVVCFSSGP